MTANLYEKNDRYHVMLSWYQGKTRKQKSVATGVLAKGNNKRAAEAARKSILDEWEAKVSDNYQDILFSDYLKQWLEIVKRSIAETTYFSYKAIVERQICPYFAERNIKLCNLKPHHIQSFYSWKMETRSVTGNTIHHYHANIHKALKHAAQTELIKDNPASKVTLPKKERFTADFYIAEELRLLLDAVKGDKIEVPVFLAAWFGLRRGEALGVRWMDVDLPSMTLSVKGVVTDKGSGSRTENIKYRSGTKTPSGMRSFPIPHEVAGYLRELKRRQAENRILAGNSYNQEWTDFLCVDQTGDLIKPDYLSRAFPAFLAKHGFRKIRFHELRDSNASLLLDKGIDMKQIQEWLGHAHYSTTADKYTHLRTDAKRRLGDVLSGELASG
jgi:integrase